MLRKILGFAAAGTLLMLLNSPAQAQSAPAGSTSLTASRTQLLASLGEFEKQANDGGYSAKLRDRAKYEASLIKQRLEYGDFQPGDKVVLLVDGEATLSDTMAVAPDLTIKLPTGENMGLKGVLRSEVQAKFLEAIKKVVREPTVHA